MFYVFQACCLHTLLVHRITGAEVTETGTNTSRPLSSVVASRPCRISYVLMEHNGTSVAKDCICEEATVGRPMNDVSRRSHANGGSHAANSSSTGWVEGTGPVPDGTLCMVSVHDRGNGRAIIAGVCHGGKCDNKNTITVKVGIPKLAADPYAYHCKGPYLNVSANCTASCYNRTTETWFNASLGDGRLCALVINGSKDGEYTKRTGVCIKGSCVPADVKPLNPPDDCPAKFTKRSGVWLAENCTTRCKTSGRMKRLPAGTRCWLNYQRTIRVPGVENVIVDGICKHGICIVTPPAVPLLKIHVPEEKCDHLLASVNYTKKVASTCSARCPGRQPEYQPLRNGTACALKESWRSYKRVTEVGECHAGSCLNKEDKKEFPPEHHQKSDLAHTCKTKDYVVVKPGQITVVASCQVECSYTVFERRSYGVSCLLEYSETTKGEKTYKIGTCLRGFCALGLNPRNITLKD
ncbi:hypothetical protein MRX96_038441 [Rhipicephalus microplus]